MALKRVTRQDIEGFVNVCEVIIGEYGAKALTDKLLQSIPLTNKDLVQSKILDEVGEAYSVSPNLIITGKKKTGTAAKILAVVMFHKYLGLNQTEIARIFKVHTTIVNRRILQFMKVKDNKEFTPGDGYAKFIDREFMEKYEQVNRKIEAHIKTSNTK